jgi:hypothetical protein
MKRCIKTSARAGLMICAAITLVGAQAGRGAAFQTSSHSYGALEPEADEDGLMLVETPTVPLINQRGPARDSNWIRLKTDACGILQQVEDGRSMFRQSDLGDDMIVDEDDEVDPSDAGRDLIDRWLSQHAETAVINEGIDKSCDRDWYGDQDLSPEFDAKFATGQQRLRTHPVPLRIA